VDREDMVRVPMRDGKRLVGSLFFMKGTPRQNLPTILTFWPYLKLKDSNSATFSWASHFSNIYSSPVGRRKRRRS